MKIFNRKNIFYFYLLGLFLLSILPINGTGSSLNNNYLLTIRLDYFAHFAVLIPYFFVLNKEFKGFWKLVKSLMIALVVASLLEIVQFFLSYRTYNVNDLVSNWFGISLSCLLYYVFMKLIKK